MPRWGPRRKRLKNKSNGQFQRRESTDAVAVDDGQPPESSTLSSMEVDDNEERDEDYQGEGSGAASGMGQTLLSFGSAAACAVLDTARAAVRTVDALCPEVAPRPHAAQPNRSTLYRRKRASIQAAQPGMRQGLAAFLRRGAEQQAQQEQQASLPQSSQRESAVEMEVGEQDNSSSSAAASGSAETHSDGDSDSDDCSDSDVLVHDGIGLPFAAWVGGDVQSAAKGFLEEQIDGYPSDGSDGFLDGLDYSSSWSDSGKESGDELDGNVEALGDGGAAATGVDCGSSDAGAASGVSFGDVEPKGTGAAGREGADSGSSGERSDGAAKHPAAGVRRSSRKACAKTYYPAKRGKAKGKAGPGRGTRVLVPDEVGNSLLGLKRKKNKMKRSVRKEQVRLVGKKWTKEERERQARRTRANCSERKQELLVIFRQGLDKIATVRVRCGWVRVFPRVCAGACP